jgi:TonB family protein
MKLGISHSYWLCVACALLLNLAPTLANGQQLSVRPSIQNIESCAKALTTYPRGALEKNIQGTVRLRFLVAASGELKRIDIRRTSGNESLDQAAVQYYSSCSFVAAKSLNGTSIAGSFEIEHVWQIK